MTMRLLSDTIGLRQTLAVTSEATGFEAKHLIDGDRHTFWKQSDQLADPGTVATLSSASTGGALSNGTYNVRYTYKTAGGQTLAAPRAQITLSAGTSTQTITVTAPVLPTGATGIKAYISLDPATETLQGESSTNVYTQTTALTSGAALPTANTAFPEQTLTLDAGSGATETADYLTLARADLLVNAGATIDLQHSPDASVWTSVLGFPFAIASGDLRKPTDQDYITEYTSLTKRAWRLRLSGQTKAAQLAGLWLGARTALAKDPRYPGRSGPTRTARGADVELDWNNLSESDGETLLTYVKNVTPGWPAERPVETDAGTVYGGIPHYLYDPDGRIFRKGETGTPILLPVVLMTPEADATFTFKNRYEIRLRWRQVV